MSGRAAHPHQDSARLAEVAQGQKPAVTFLSCSDSRVPVEVLFDQGIGDVFTVRVAGNVADKFDDNGPMTFLSMKAMAELEAAAKAEGAPG